MSIDNLNKKLESFSLEDFLKERKLLEDLSMNILKNEPSLMGSKQLNWEGENIFNPLKNTRPEDVLDYIKEKQNKKKVEKKQTEDAVLDAILNMKHTNKVDKLSGVPLSLDDMKMFRVYVIEGNTASLNIIDDLKNSDGLFISARASKINLDNHKITAKTHNNIDKDIINHIISEFFIYVKKLSESHKNATSLRDLPILKKSDYENIEDFYKQIRYREGLCSSIIRSEYKNIPPNFILGSENNILLIIDSIKGTTKKCGKTSIFKVNSTYETYNYIIDDEMENTIVIGRCPEESEPGINLFINKNSLYNYEYSTDDDISAVNIFYQFYAVGKFPQLNYLSFDITD